VSRVAGGRGAARDLLERVLKAQRRWNAIVAAHGVAASIK
jgi:3-deoxy-D-manno-octulosonate 8-phosphate phosphatase KdsC-like HAD superfamily phosphatase